MTAYVVPPAYCQFDWSANTASNGCTWTSGSNGIRAATGRSINPDVLHAKVKRSEETNPATPGWSIPDLDLACSRVGVGFANRSGSLWGAVVAYHDAGYALVVQGDSDQFSNATCSGKFDGDHAVCIHPQEGARGYWLLYDPICQGYRYESPAVLRRYAEKLDKRIRFGQFTTKVPTTQRGGGHLAARKGTYKTYRTVNGRAVPLGTLKTGGFPNAPAMTFTARQVDGTGKTSLVKLLDGAHEGTILYRYAAGLKYTED